VDSVRRRFGGVGGISSKAIDSSMSFMKKNLDKVASDNSKLTDKRRIKIMKGGDPRETGGFTALRESQRQSMSVLG